MDGARARWTDERLDGFAALVDQRLNRADEQARRKRDEREQRRWDQSQQRFESRMRLIFWMYGVAVGMALGTIVTVLANRS